MDSKKELLKQKEKLNLWKATKKLTPYALTTGLLYGCFEWIAFQSNPNMRGISIYEMEYNVYHKYIDIYGNEYTNDIKTKLSVLKNSFLTYYYDFQRNDFGRRTCSYATFHITELENFDIMELPKDMEELTMMFGKPNEISDGYSLIIYPEEFSGEDSYFTAELYTRDEGVKVPLEKIQVLHLSLY